MTKFKKNWVQVELYLFQNMKKNCWKEQQRKKKKLIKVLELP